MEGVCKGRRGQSARWLVLGRMVLRDDTASSEGPEVVQRAAEGLQVGKSLLAQGAKLDGNDVGVTVEVEGFQSRVALQEIDESLARGDVMSRAVEDDVADREGLELGPAGRTKTRTITGLVAGADDGEGFEVGAAEDEHVPKLGENRVALWNEEAEARTRSRGRRRGSA